MRPPPYQPARPCLSVAPYQATSTYRSELTGIAPELEQAHRQGVGAATAGLRDAALGRLRLSGQAVRTLAEAAVSSATPFLRAPLLARISRAILLHPVAGQADGRCPSCGVPAPCATARELSQ